MKYAFGFGKETVYIDLPEKSVIAELRPNEAEIDLTGEAEVLRSLREPIDSRRLRDIVHPGEKIAIVTSDITRPLPSYKILPCNQDSRLNLLQLLPCIF